MLDFKAGSTKVKQACFVDAPGTL